MKKILIVEDDPVIGRVYATKLMQAGYELEVVQDGQAGCARILDSKPDAVLLDLMLPNLNGIEILKSVRATPGLVDLPVIVFTNACVPQMIEQARQAGATMVFDKIYLSPQELLQTLRQYVPPAEKAA